MAERQVQPRREQHQPARLRQPLGGQRLGEPERQSPAGRVAGDRDRRCVDLGEQLAVDLGDEGIGLAVGVLRGQAVERHLHPHAGVGQLRDQRPVLLGDLAGVGAAVQVDGRPSGGAVPRGDGGARVALHLAGAHVVPGAQRGRRLVRPLGSRDALPRALHRRRPGLPGQAQDARDHSHLQAGHGGRRPLPVLHVRARRTLCAAPPGWRGPAGAGETRSRCLYTLTTTQITYTKCLPQYRRMDNFFVYLP